MKQIKIKLPFKKEVGKPERMVKLKQWAAATNRNKYEIIEEEHLDRRSTITIKTK
jgi:hypothetical protein